MIVDVVNISFRSIIDNITVINGMMKFDVDAFVAVSLDNAK